MNILARARTFLGLTQAEMADALGISRSTYQRREALADAYVPLSERTTARVLAMQHADAEVVGTGYSINWMEPTRASGGTK